MKTKKNSRKRTRNTNVKQFTHSSKRFLRPRKGIKIFPFKDLFRKLHLRPSQVKILRVCFTSFSPKFQAKKTSFFLRKEAKKLYI